MKLFSVIFFVAVVFVAENNCGSPSMNFMSSSSMFMGSSSGSIIPSSSARSSSNMMGSSSSSMMSSSTTNMPSSSMMGSSSSSKLSSMMGSSSSSMTMSSSSDQGVCYVVAQVIYEFNTFTSNILKMYISSFHRSAESTKVDKSEKLGDMVEMVEKHEAVPKEDKEALRDLYERGDKERGWTDQFTHDNIWDCFVGIYTGALSGVLAP